MHHTARCSRHGLIYVFWLSCLNDFLFASFIAMCRWPCLPVLLYCVGTFQIWTVAGVLLLVQWMIVLQRREARRY